MMIKKALLIIAISVLLLSSVTPAYQAKATDLGGAWAQATA